MKMTARLVAPLIVVVALAQLSAQPSATLSIDTLMATPFPTDLVAAPSGGRIAWVSSHSGVHNVLVADPATVRPAPTSGEPSRPTPATMGCGSPSSDGRATPKTVVYVRGDSANRQGESPNPAQLQDGTEQAVLRGERRRRRAEASRRRQRAGCRRRAANASRGCRAARSGASISDRRRSRRGWSTRAAARRASRGRRTDRCSPSPAAAAPIATSACSRSRRRSCATSIPRSIATAIRCGRPTDRASPGCARARRRGRRCFRRAATVDEPWSLRVADVKTGQARQVWKADAGYGSAFQGVVADSQLYWGARRSARVPVGEGRLAAPLFRASGGRRRAVADTRQFRSGVRDIAPDRVANHLQLQPGRHRQAPRLDGARRRIGKAVAPGREVDRQRMAAGHHQRRPDGDAARRRAACRRT